MPAVRVAINGFGRIGRTAFIIALDKYQKDIEIVAVNDLSDAKTLAHLLKYDTNYGLWKRDIRSDQKGIIVDQKAIEVLSIREPDKLPWKDLKVDIVLECTGRFTESEGARRHLKAGAKRVIVSAPSKDIPTFVLGVNGTKYNGEELINNASCTTNCIAPVAQVMEIKFGVLKAMMTTIHSYTADQNLQDGPHKDLRRARSAAENIVPTTTGAAIATTETVPALKGLFNGVAIRVPTPVGSLSDFTFLLKKKVTVEEINNAFKEVAKNESFKNILAVTEDPIVSSDIIGRPESAIMDLSLTQVVDGDMVKVFAWYDNEYGYSNRLIEQVMHVGRTLK